uniref:Ovule protein n=1 Tax=Brugia timori TaxID=42155 RepID=A0A0R3QC32_9BILA
LNPLFSISFVVFFNFNFTSNTKLQESKYLLKYFIYVMKTEHFNTSLKVKSNSFR